MKFGIFKLHDFLRLPAGSFLSMKFRFWRVTAHLPAFLPQQLPS
jgi:hypothetical protein